MIDGTIASVAWDTSVTSSAGKFGDPYIQRDQLSTKVLSVADVHITTASNVAKLHRPFREPDCTVNIFSALDYQSLLSGNKFVKAGYISICNGEKVKIYDGCTIKIVLSEAELFKG